MGWNLSRLGALLLAALVVGCGGGGDGAVSGANPTPGGGAGAAPVLSASTTRIAVATAPTDLDTDREVTLDIGSLPSEGLYIYIGHTDVALVSVDFHQASATSGVMGIVFRGGAVLGLGSHRDSIVVDVCFDTTCKRPIPGSPLTVNTTVEVTAPNAAKIDRSRVEVGAAAGSAQTPSASVTIATTGPLAASTLRIKTTYNAYQSLRSVGVLPVDDHTVRIDIGFAPAFYVPGDYTETVTVQVCYDYACTFEVAGSPFVVTTQYKVHADAQPEPGMAPLPTSFRTALAHNVVDAEFSRALNAVVSVATWPNNALHVYDLASRIERTLPLVKAPTSVSVSPDGLTAAVGHDALVTHVELASVAGPTPQTRLLTLSTDAGDVVLDGHGVVHVFAGGYGWSRVHSIVVASNVETLHDGFWGPYGGSKARLHPSGNDIYAANNGLSPADIENYLITGNTVEWLRDSPYHGDYSMCGNLWFSDDGARIFTACGNTFRSSTVAADDMVYAGRLPFGTLDKVDFVSSLSATREAAVIESPAYDCQPYGQINPCYSHLSLYEPEFLARVSSYSIPPVAVNGASYEQRGLYVFHQSGGGKVLISRLTGIADPATQYQLSVIP